MCHWPTWPHRTLWEILLKHRNPISILQFSPVKRGRRNNDRWKWIQQGSILHWKHWAHIGALSRGHLRSVSEPRQGVPYGLPNPGAALKGEEFRERARLGQNHHSGRNTGFGSCALTCLSALAVLPPAGWLRAAFYGKMKLNGKPSQQSDGHQTLGGSKWQQRKTGCHSDKARAAVRESQVPLQDPAQGRQRTPAVAKARMSWPGGGMDFSEPGAGLGPFHRKDKRWKTTWRKVLG